jgi:hypothetical protein
VEGHQRGDYLAVVEELEKRSFTVSVDDNSGDDNSNNPPPNSDDCLGAGTPPANIWGAPPSNDPTAPAYLVPNPDNPVSQFQDVPTVSGYASGAIYQYQLYDGLGAAMTQGNIPVTEIVVGTNQALGSGPYVSTQGTDSATQGGNSLLDTPPSGQLGVINDFVGITTAYPSALVPPNYASNSTTQLWAAEWQGQTIGLTTVNNQQAVTIGDGTYTCVTTLVQ